MIDFPFKHTSQNQRSKSQEWKLGESSSSYQSIYTLQHLGFSEESMSYGFQTTWRLNDDWKIILSVFLFKKLVESCSQFIIIKEMESTGCMKTIIEMLEFWFDVLLLYMLSVILQLSTLRKTVFLSHITQLLKANCLSFLKRHNITSSSLYSLDFSCQTNKNTNSHLCWNTVGECRWIS